jgi:hypothetical protein
VFNKLKFKALLVSMAFLLLAAGASADVSGTWSMAVEITGVGGGTPTVTMAQDAQGNITGSYTGQLGSAAPITGKATGADFEFTMSGEMGSVTYKGALQEDGTVKGTLDLSGMASGTFTGKKI